LVRGRCYECESKWNREHRPEDTKFYQRAAWRRFRSAVLAERPLCQHCGTAPANEVHHVRRLRDHLELAYDWGNVEALCKACHSELTRQERFNRPDRITWQPVSDRWVVCGAPGSGKTTWLQNNMTTDAVTWDMDARAAELGYPNYPRPHSVMRQLLRERDDFVTRASHLRQPIGAIVSATNVAYNVARKLRAGLVWCRWPEKEVTQLS